MKKTIFILFILSLLPIIYFILYKEEINNRCFFYLTSIFFLFGTILYPFDSKFRSVEDFLVIPFVVYFIFLIIEIFIIRSFNEKISVFNMLFGAFGFTQYYLHKKGFKKW